MIERSYVALDLLDPLMPEIIDPAGGLAHVVDRIDLGVGDFRG